MLAENMPDFYLGSRDTLKFEITVPGDLANGILDYGIVSGPNGLEYTGYLAAVKTNLEIIPEIVLDRGILKLPDGRVLNGEFSITFSYGAVLFFESLGSDLSFSKNHYVFRGSIKY
jgi:hypothetical protein